MRCGNQQFAAECARGKIRERMASALIVKGYLRPHCPVPKFRQFRVAVLVAANVKDHDPIPSCRSADHCAYLLEWREHGTPARRTDVGRNRYIDNDVYAPACHEERASSGIANGRESSKVQGRFWSGLADIWLISDRERLRICPSGGGLLACVAFADRVDILASKFTSKRLKNSGKARKPSFAPSHHSRANTRALARCVIDATPGDE